MILNGYENPCIQYNIILKKGGNNNTIGFVERITKIRWKDTKNTNGEESETVLQPIVEKLLKLGYLLKRLEITSFKQDTRCKGRTQFNIDSLLKFESC
jgi:hypothetical protein